MFINGVLICHPAIISHCVLLLQLFAKILYNGSESGSVTLANQTHVHVTKSEFDWPASYFRFRYARSSQTTVLMWQMLFSSAYAQLVKSHDQPSMKLRKDEVKVESQPYQKA